MKNFFSASLILFVLIFLSSCSKKHDFKPKSLIIQNIVIDSCIQISNPLSFFVNISSSNTSFKTPLYDIPFSNSNFFPSGIWNDLNYNFDLTSTITLEIFFQFPGSTQVFQEANSSFSLIPDEYTSGPNKYPPRIVFIGNPGPYQTQLTLNVLWK